MNHYNYNDNLKILRALNDKTYLVKNANTDKNNQDLLYQERDLFVAFINEMGLEKPLKDRNHFSARISSIKNKYATYKDSRIPKHMQEYIAAAPALFSEWDKEIEERMSKKNSSQGQSNASGDRTMLGSCDSSSSLNFPSQIPSDRRLSNLEDDQEYQSEICIPGYVYGDQSERGSGGNLHNLNGEQYITLQIMKECCRLFERGGNGSDENEVRVLDSCYQNMSQIR